MTKPNSIGNSKPRGDDWVVKELAMLRQEIRELRAASIGNAMTVDGPPGLQIIGGGNLSVKGGGGVDIEDDGTLNVDGSTHMGGDVDISGDLNVSGTFSLPDQSIQDDWLANPLAFVVVNKSGGTNPPVASPVALLTQTITVPAGFTRAFIYVTGTTSLIPNGSAGNTLGCYVFCSAGAIQSNANSVFIPANQFGTAMSTLGMSASGLTGGGTFTISQFAGMSASIPSNSANSALAGLVLFLR